MNIQAILEQLLGEFKDKLSQLDGMTPRKTAFPVAQNKIKVAIGMRRTGKTYFMYQKIKQLLDEGVPFTQILYINFEDDRLLPLTREKLADLIEAFYSLYPSNHEKKCYFFLDEIQNVPDWPIVIRRFHDSKNTEIYLSGSSAKLLSKEIATNLRGRSLATEIWPYSFNEYLTAKQIPSEFELFDKKTEDTLQKHFYEYLSCGGFPEVIHYQTDERIKTLQEYIDVVIYRDIIERHAVKHPSLIKYMILFMLTNVSRPFSINKFYNDVKGQGYKISKDTLYNYADHIEDAYLAFLVGIYDTSIRKAQTNPKKIFAIDPGLINAVRLNTKSDHCKLFENIIYLDLKRQGYNVYYYLTKDRYEVDFLVQTPTGKEKLIQVCWDMSDPKTREREERALEKAQQELNIDGDIITLSSYLKSGVALISD